MRKAKQIGSLVLAVVMLMAMIGCVSVDPAGSMPPVTTEPELQGQLTAPTAPVTVPSSTPTEPQQPSDPTVPSVPSGNEGQSQSGNETQATQPTEPPATVSVTTAPLPTEHTHSYTDTVVAATCSTQGYTRHTCSCGHSYDDNHTAADPNTHSYVQHVRQTTCSLEGVTYYVCSECGSSYMDEGSFVVKLPHTPAGDAIQVVAPTVRQGYSIYHCSVCDQDYHTDYVDPTEEQKQAFIDAVEAALVKYINQYRAEQGSTQLTYLPGMSQVAQYRSVQLVTNFAHDTDDKREALAYYQYGRYVDFAEAGCPELVDQNYYEADSKEAIGKGNYSGSTDEIGYKMASGVKGSSGHWRYVGSSDYSYIGVGCTYKDGTWYICIMVGRTDYG